MSEKNRNTLTWKERNRPTIIAWIIGVAFFSATFGVWVLVSGSV